MKILINTSNLYVGGGLQVALSFINELKTLNKDHEYQRKRGMTPFGIACSFINELRHIELETFIEAMRKMPNPKCVFGILKSN